MFPTLLYEFTKIFMLFVTASAFLYSCADMSVEPEAVDQTHSLTEFKKNSTCATNLSQLQGINENRSTHYFF